MKLPNIFRQNVDSHLDVVLNPAADGFLKKSFTSKIRSDICNQVAVL